jgi:uncharacterized protein
MKELFRIKTISFTAGLKDVDGKKGIMTGYFNHFDNVDAQGDIVRPGTFIKTIKEIGPDSTMPRIKHLLNHNSTQPIGKLQVLKEDYQANGLYYESLVGKHKLGKDVIDMAESGLITEHSLMLIPTKEKPIQTWSEYKANPAKGFNEILEAKMPEGSSLTFWGANELTPLTGVKSTEDIDRIAARVKALEKFCRNSDASDETIELLLIECKQLSQMLIDTTKPPETGTLPDNSAEIAKAILHFANSL